MKITRSQLRKILTESMSEEGSEDASMLNSLITSFDKDYIKQAAQLSADLNMSRDAFRDIVRYAIDEKLDATWQIGDTIASDIVGQLESIVQRFLGIGLADSELTVDNESTMVDAQMEFGFGLTGAVLNLISNYFTSIIMAIYDEALRE